MTAIDIIETLVRKGVIPAEYKGVAALELDRELDRRCRRMARILATCATEYQFAIKYASSKLA